VEKKKPQRFEDLSHWGSGKEKNLLGHVLVEGGAGVGRPKKCSKAGKTGSDLGKGKCEAQDNLLRGGMRIEKEKKAEGGGQAN